MRQVTKNQETKFFELSKSNFTNFKFNSLISPINNSNFSKESIKTTHNKKDFIREKVTYDPQLIFEIKKTFSSSTFRLLLKWKNKKIFFCKRILL